MGREGFLEEVTLSWVWRDKWDVTRERRVFQIRGSMEIMASGARKELNLWCAGGCPAHRTCYYKISP